MERTSLFQGRRLSVISAIFTVVMAATSSSEAFNFKTFTQRAPAKASAASSYRLQKLSVNGQAQKLSGQAIQAQLKTSANTPVSGVLCDNNCLNQLQLSDQSKSSLCTSGKSLLAQYQGSSAFSGNFIKAFDGICASDGYSADVHSLVLDALKNVDSISKDNQGLLDVQAGNVDMQFAPITTVVASESGNSSAPVPKQPTVVQCSAGQSLGEDGQCHAPAAPVCPAGQGISEADGKCHVISNSNVCPAGQAIFETDGQCHVIQSQGNGASEN